MISRACVHCEALVLWYNTMNGTAQSGRNLFMTFVMAVLALSCLRCTGFFVSQRFFDVKKMNIFRVKTCHQNHVTKLSIKCSMCYHTTLWYHVEGSELGPTHRSTPIFLPSFITIISIKCFLHRRTSSKNEQLTASTFLWANAKPRSKINWPTSCRAIVTSGASSWHQGNNP